MTSWDSARLLYLVLLGGALIAYLFVANRDRMGQMARHAVLWGLIFVGLIAAVGLWGDIRTQIVPQQAVAVGEGRIEVPRAFDGHYYLTLRANDTPVRFVVDTGASEIVLSRDDAARAGIDPDRLVYTGVANTANGTVRTARATLDTLELGPITDRNVSVWVNEGEMFGSLLGMAYLNRFDSLQIRGETLVLER